MAGESTVMRVLDRTTISLDLGQVGMKEDEIARFRELIRKPNGIILVTGPTGSGKTTTLYSSLNEMNDGTSKIITVEDPIEYDLEGVIQVQMDEGAGRSFSNSLRSILRQDPDVILVGEIRDLETASLSIEASLTGHIVFSTLHTNDAPTAVTRLIDLGIEPYLVAATVEGIIAQRLVRTICHKCKTRYTPRQEDSLELNLRPEEMKDRVLYYGKGCENCNSSGYRGRTGIFEIMVLNEPLKDLIMQQVSTNELSREAARQGMRNLRQSGLLAVFDGVTTAEEVVRVTQFST
jgi:type IV pilus assembly protein PilB